MRRKKNNREIYEENFYDDREYISEDKLENIDEVFGSSGNKSYTSHAQEEVNEVNEDKEKATEIRKCASCGANMAYDPETLSLKCPYCGSNVALQFNDKCHEQEFYKLFENNLNEWMEDTHAFRCENCGAKQVVSKTEISKKCAFCGTDNVVELKELSGMKPNAVLPFLIGKEKASENFIAWAKKKKFAPRKFKKSVEAEEVNGNYVPCFTFDSQTYSDYSGVLGEHYYVTVYRNGKSVREQRTRWFKIKGTHTNFFDDVLVPASDTVPGRDVAELEPFDTNNSQNYSSDYLQGFTASQYSKDGKQCWHEGQEIMKNRIKQQILSKYHYDVVKRLDVNTTFNDVSFKYVLIPLYIGHCTYAKKLYNFFVNGQTGKVSGKTPVSALKVTAVVVLAVAALIGLVILSLKYGG